MQETCQDKLQRLSVSYESKKGFGNRDIQVPGRCSTATLLVDRSNGRGAQENRRSNSDRAQSPQIQPISASSNDLIGSVVKSAARRRFAADSDSDDDSDSLRRPFKTLDTSAARDIAVSKIVTTPQAEPGERVIRKPSTPSRTASATVDQSDSMLNALADAVRKGSVAPNQPAVVKKPYFPHPVFGAPKVPNQEKYAENRVRTVQENASAPARATEPIARLKNDESTLQRGAASHTTIGSSASFGTFKNPSRSHSPSHRSTSPAGGRSEGSVSRSGNRRRSFRIDSDSDSDDAPSTLRPDQDKNRRRSAPLPKSNGKNHGVGSGNDGAGQRPSAYPAGGTAAPTHNPAPAKSKPDAQSSQVTTVTELRTSSSVESLRRTERSEPPVAARRSAEPSAVAPLVTAERQGEAAVKPLASPPAARPGAAAAILRVRRGCTDGSAYATIMDAVHAAQAGQTVQIEPGAYPEELCIDKPLQLRAVGDSVVVHASSGHSAVTCRAAGILLSGLTLVHTGGDPSRRGRSSARCVEVFSGDVSMIKCDVRSEVGSGVIVADKGSVSVQGSVLQGCGKCGALVFDGGNLLCNDSIVSRNGLYGMVIQNGGTASVEGNRINGNKHAGILVHGKGSVGNVRSNDISSNGEMGVGVQNGAEVRLEKNKVSSNQHAGLFVDGEGSRATVRECEFVDNGVRGVGVQSGAEARIQASRVAGNSQEGVFVSGRGSRATVQDSDVVHNGTKGLGVQSGAAATAVSNRISGNQEEGVFVSDAGSQCSVRDNSIVENGMKGVGVQSGGQADVDGNLISGNQREGVYVSGAESKALVQNNDVTSNGVKGVGVQDGADVAVEGNRISGNHYVGVHVYGPGSRAVIRENDIHSNSLAAVVTESGGAVQSGDNRIDGVKEADLVSESAAAHDATPTSHPRGPRDGLTSGDGRAGAEIPMAAPSSGGAGGGAGGDGEEAAAAYEVVVEIGRGTDLPQPDDAGAELFLSLSLMDAAAGRGAPVWVDHKGARGARASSRPHGKGTAEDPLVIVPQVPSAAARRRPCQHQGGGGQVWRRRRRCDEQSAARRRAAVGWWRAVCESRPSPTLPRCFCSLLRCLPCSYPGGESG